MAELMLPSLTENTVELKQQTRDFVLANNTLFPAKTPEDIQKAKSIADKSVSAKHLNKNVTPYLAKMTTFAGSVVNVEEQTMDDGETVALMHILDNNFQSYQVLLFKTTGDILQQDNVRFWGVPVGPYSFPNVSGGTTNVQYFLGTHVEKQK